MIQSFKDKMTEEAFNGRVVKGFPAQLLSATRRRLFQLHAASVLDDLKSPPGNRLHALKEDREGQHSISVNDQFRICFVWTENGPSEVEFTDYH